ncbi:lipid-A-disaccharide synthase [Desulfoluna spongiiphila]|uniref:Lipid-A-disaccharide synthase n=1 Tax=Desulfoluna spongiiphila TaxID=419481 RepID=A0A1G5DAP5_9BACT|nr:lipid-A-disaccharide synthase [Desulfoluna spongiiphila]SCY11792.1 lipid-A-disaccharide synthase [Desulfoluna spongiiphila]
MKLFIVAGEPSGDMHATELVHALKNASPDIDVYSAGGPGLAACSTQVEDLASLAVTGFFEVISYLPTLIRVFNRIAAKIEEINPDVVIFTDYPDFNFRMAKRVAKPGRKLVYFISPQLWAWRKGRLKLVKQYIDKMLVIFPFEEGFYKENGVEAAFVGNPLVNTIPAMKAETRKEAGPRRILLLPGSRSKEVKSNLATMCQAKKAMDGRLDARYSVLKHPSLDATLFKSAHEAGIRVFEGNPHDEFQKVDLAIACSGTVTFELALSGVPTVVLYRMNAVTYHVAKRLVKVDAISIPNLILGHHVFPELIQDAATPEGIAEEVVTILSDPERLGRIRDELGRFRTLVKAFDADYAAREIFSLVKK